MARYVLLALAHEGGCRPWLIPECLPPADRRAGNADRLRGFRVPGLLISPWSPRGSVPHTVYDHTSVLALIEWRWGLKPLTVRDRTANNLAAALDFNHPNRSAPHVVMPPGPFGAPCPSGSTTHDEEWAALQELAQSYGWPVG